MKNRILPLFALTTNLMVLPFALTHLQAKIYATIVGIFPHPNGCREVIFILWDDNGTPLNHSDDKKLGYHKFFHCPEVSGKKWYYLSSECLRRLSYGILC
jgi:hypothetical protein